MPCIAGGQATTLANRKRNGKITRGADMAEVRLAELPLTVQLSSVAVPKNEL